MAKVTLPAGHNPDSPEETIEIDLANPTKAALLAWLVPGLGHVYQGRTGKGMLFFICILGTFFYGMYLGQAKVVYAALPSPGSPTSFSSRWQYALQFGTGVVTWPALAQALHDPTGEEPLLGTRFMAPPRQRPFDVTDESGNATRQPNEESKWITQMHPNYDLGTIYAVVAGLLNLIVICDAYAGPLVLVQRQPSKEGPPDDASAESNQQSGKKSKPKGKKKAKS